LLRERGDVYHKDEGPHHVLIYIELEDFLFIDYVYVSAASRGQGIGRRLIEQLQANGKPIILEVEPLDYDDSDTEKRRRFYTRAGFQQARAIGYRRRSLATDRVNPLEILFWSPLALTEEAVLASAKLTYETIHTYKDRLFYGRSYQPADEVFSFDPARAVRLDEAA
jgi:GNAT superfamily N-acetyltransferase